MCGSVAEYLFCVYKVLRQFLELPNIYKLAREEPKTEELGPSPVVSLAFRALLSFLLLTLNYFSRTLCFSVLALIGLLLPCTVARAPASVSLCPSVAEGVSSGFSLNSDFFSFSFLILNRVSFCVLG